jgi:hypothetical protein
VRESEKGSLIVCKREGRGLSKSEKEREERAQMRKSESVRVYYVTSHCAWALLKEAGTRAAQNGNRERERGGERGGEGEGEDRLTNLQSRSDFY